MTTDHERDVASHYGQSALLEAILKGLKASGADLNNITVEDLAPVDEFHTAGRPSTLKALAHMKLQPGMHILDVGAGIGGAARVLAVEHGCQVTGVDLTPEFVDVAKELTERMGLSQQCTFEVGSGTRLRFENESFDGCITFHVAMNIEDRRAFYSEIARVLKSGGQFCLFDIMQGPVSGLEFPVPWASGPETSFLKTPGETKRLVEQSGLEIIAEESLKEFAMEFFQKFASKAAETDGPPPLGLHLLMGNEAEVRYSNAIKAAQKGATEPVIMVARKP